MYHHGQKSSEFSSAEYSGGTECQCSLLHSTKFLISNFFQWATSGIPWDAKIWEIYFLVWLCSIAVFSQKIQLLKMLTSYLIFPFFFLLLRIGGRKSAKVQKFRWKAIKCSQREQRKKVDYSWKKRKLYVWKMWIVEARLHKQLSFLVLGHDTHIIYSSHLIQNKWYGRQKML